MQRLLIAWELGSGLGHVGPLRAVGRVFARRGYLVAVASPNIQLCRQALADTAVATLPVPSLPPSDRRLKIPCTYSDVLHDCGYSSTKSVTAAVHGCLDLLDRRRPDLLLADYAPAAMLAARARGVPVAATGTGFVCPPDVTPLPSLHADGKRSANYVDRSGLDRPPSEPASLSAALVLELKLPLPLFTAMLGMRRGKRKGGHSRTPPFSRPFHTPLFTPVFRWNGKLQ